MAGLFDSIFSGEGGIASTLIDLAGKKVSYYSFIKGYYDPLTGVKNDSTSVTTNVSITPFDKYTSYEIDNTNIQKDDMKTYIKATDLANKPVLNKDYILDNGIKYVVINYSPYDTGSEIACYELQLRVLEN